MIKLTHKITQENFSLNELETMQTLSMTLDMRIRTRQRVLLDDGTEAGLFLERGQLIRGGDILSDDAHYKVRVLAANETVSTVFCDDPLELTKAAYHLGNRHVPLQIEKGWLRYQHDHVLDEMIELFGLKVVVSQAPFEPEAGAYQQQGSHTAHSHSHAHEHGHSH